MTGPRLENQNQNNPNPDPQNPENPNPNPSPDLETPTQDTAPVNNDVVPRSEYDATLQNTHALYRQTLIENERQRRELQSQLDAANAARNNNQQQPVPDDQLTPAQLIAREVRNQVSPLLQEFQGFRVNQEQQTYQTIKNNFRNLPAFSPFFAQLEPYLDQEMQGKAVTVENVQDSLAKIIGRFQMQNALNPQPIQQNQSQNTQQPLNTQQNNMPNNNQQNLPAHLRPSAPPLPNRNGNQNLTPGGNPRRPLSELEKRVARENKLNEDQYIDWISVDPMNVIHTDIGRPPRTP